MYIYIAYTNILIYLNMQLFVYYTYVYIYIYILCSPNDLKSISLIISAEDVRSALVAQVVFQGAKFKVLVPTEAPPVSTGWRISHVLLHECTKTRPPFYRYHCLR